MKSIIYWVGIACLMFVVTYSGCGEKANVKESEEIVFATGVASGEELDALSRAVVRAIEERVPQSNIVPIGNPRGTAEVIENIASYDLCGLNLDEAAEAYCGFFTWKGQPHLELRLLCVMGNLPIAFVVAANSDIKSVYDLNGKSFGNGGEENAAAFKATKLLEALDIEPEWNRDSWLSQVELYKQGKLVGFIKSGACEPILKEIYRHRPFVVLELSESELATAGQCHHGTGLTYPPCLIRPETYPGQTETVTTYGLLLGYYARQGVSSQITYKLLKAMWEDVWDVSACYEPLKLDIIAFPKFTLEHGAFPLHTGAVEFYKELGLEIPGQLMPPEMR